MKNSNASDSYYREQQYFSLWVHLFTLILIPGIFVASANPESRQAIMAHALVFLIVALSALLITNALRMNTEVRKETLHIDFGLLFPMLWKNIPLDAIIEARSIVYRPIRDAGGWGYRRGRFEKYRLWFYTARGNKGVLLQTREGKQYIIGSQQPDALEASLKKCYR